MRDIILARRHGYKEVVVLKILFLGNDPELTEMYGKILKRRGYEVDCHVVPSGEEATLEHRRADLVIADIEASEADRTRLCRLVKRWVKPPKLMFITNSGEDEIPTLNAGADDWLKKPYRMDVLLARIAALLR